MKLTVPSYIGRATSHFVVDAAVVEQLEQLPLSHSVPSRVSDHICVRLVRLQRWLSEKLLRERYIHRATMHHSLYASSAAAMASSLKLRSMWAPKRRRRKSSASEGSADASAPLLEPQFTGGADDGEVKTAANFVSSRTSVYSSLLSDNVVANSCSEALSCTAMDALRASHSEQELHFRHFLCMRELIGYTRPELVLQAVVMTVNYVVLLLLSLASPRTAHRLVGYTMEESSVVLTHMVNDIDTAKVDERTLPDIVTKYYRFVETTTTSKSGGGVATANNGSKQAAASETTAADVPRVACLRTLALLIRSDHISLAEWHHAMADELDEKKRDAGAGSSFS